MKRFILVLSLLLVSTNSFAQGYWAGSRTGIVDPYGTPIGSSTAPLVTSAPVSSTLTNPTSTLTLPSTTTAYGAGKLIASSATAGSVVVPSFTLVNTGGIIQSLILTSNDNTSTAYPGMSVQVDLWDGAPTFTNGDRGTYAIATGSAYYVASFTCTVSTANGDGFYARCAPTVGNFVATVPYTLKTIYWTMQAVTAGGATGASKTWTLTAEVLN